MDRTPYRIAAFYDSETNNVEDLVRGHSAFPILHQLGTIANDVELKDIDVSNVRDLVDVRMYRHVFEVCEIFDSMMEWKDSFGFVPVVAVHNLGFDMHSLSDWLSSHDVRVLAKSSTKPISFTILDDAGDASLVLWDTLQFSGKSLERMGADCGMPKLKGKWDYERQRTPHTELTDDEMAYAEQDVLTLAAWMGFWCRSNPDIPESKLGLNVVTKTGIVRAKRSILFDQVKGEGCRYNVGRFWMHHNRKEMPKSDEELFTVQACTRGGFTFCASKHASVVFETSGGQHVYGYDATSMHPSQMVSHYYPHSFSEASATSLQYAARTVMFTPLERVLSNWAKPFPCAFEACFEFRNIRPRSGSVYERHGIHPLAWARMSEQEENVNEDNEAQHNFLKSMRNLGYRDSAIEPDYAFGKLVSAKSCRLYLTELAFWEVCQAYEFDSFEAVHGYISNRFCKPTDMSMLSVMHFYTAKRVFKEAMLEYERNGRISNREELEKYAPPGLVEEMANGTASENDVRLQMQNIKADLNALFGVECTNEFRDDTILTENGIGYAGSIGLENAPKNPKSWYQFGQRIVGWSRIMQHAALQLVSPYVDAVICGDTDSLKILFHEDSERDVDSALSRISDAIDSGKAKSMERARRNYPDVFDSLDGIGYYVKEFSTDRFCASWNKAYVMKEDGYRFTIAGITTNRRHVYSDGNVFPNSYNDLAEFLEGRGWTFAEVCNLLLGYNIMVDSSITKINGRKAPVWGSSVFGTYTDWRGDSAVVSECASLALFNMPKLVNGIDSKENLRNMRIAVRNNPDVNTEYRILRWLPGREPAVMYL